MNRSHNRPGRYAEDGSSWSRRNRRPCNPSRKFMFAAILPRAPPPPFIAALLRGRSSRNKKWRIYMQSSFIRTSFMVLGLVVAFVFVPLSGLQPEAAAQGVEESVTGHVEFVNRNNPANIVLVRYSVNAIRHSDGSVSGEVQGERRNEAGHLISHGHGTVTCFTLVGNIALIGGKVDRNEPPLNSVLTDFRLTVIDNGQGSNDPPDIASPIIVGRDGT